MRLGLSFGALIFLAFVFLHGKALGAEFVIVGPRAMGMGGAGVAITTDALATYWNPAGLAMTQTVDVRIVGGAQAIDRLGIADAVSDLENFDTTDTSPANVAKAQDIANRINRPGANTSFNGAAGLYLKGHFGEHAFGFNISNVPTGGGFVSSPVGVSCSPPGMTMPGIDMLAVPVTMPMSTNPPLADRNSTVKVLRPRRSVPVGALTRIWRSPDCTR